VKGVLLIGLASLCFAASEPIVSLASLKSVESSIKDRLESNIGDPYDLLGGPRGTYLEGYGAVFTVHLNLVLLPALRVSPFNPNSGKEITGLHDHKARKVEELKATMRELMTGASRSLPGLPPRERIVMEAFLFDYSWEQTRGLPHRVMLTAFKQELLDAVGRHATPAEMAALFTEDEL
jgi:hypothetical protein